MNASTRQIIAPVSVRLADAVGQSAVQSYPDEGLPTGLPIKVHVAILAVTAALSIAMAFLL